MLLTTALLAVNNTTTISNNSLSPMESHGNTKSSASYRMACVNIAKLPLQLLLRENPDWRRHPVAVLDRNKPQGRILWVNAHARRKRILPGLTYAAALSLCGSLRARDVPGPRIEKAIETLARHLRRYTPVVEAVKADKTIKTAKKTRRPKAEELGEPGIFWLNASGLDRIYDSLAQWAQTIRTSMARLEGLECVVVVGFSKLGTYVISKEIAATPSASNKSQVCVFDEPSQEENATKRAPLQLLALVPTVRDTLTKLGVHTLSDFADLPPEGMERRFDQKTARLHRLARGEIELPLEPRLFEESPRQKVHLDYAEKDLSRLLKTIGRLLEEVLKTLTERHQALAELQLTFVFEDDESSGPSTEHLRPAVPTLDLVQLLDLIHLRLEQRFSAGKIGGGVTDVFLNAGGQQLDSEQLDLFAETPPRDLAAAERALARIRAELGNHAVVRAKLGEGHLPNALFSWELFEKIPPARPREAFAGEKSWTLVRRIFSRPVLLPARPRHEPDGWMLRGLEQGPVIRVLGPYIISGGWWHRPIQREYHFAETQKGEILWAYYDRFRRRWFLHGVIQ